jgi:hypothetical protein
MNHAAYGQKRRSNDGFGRPVAGKGEAGFTEAQEVHEPPVTLGTDLWFDLRFRRVPEKASFAAMLQFNLTYKVSGLVQYKSSSLSQPSSVAFYADVSHRHLNVAFPFQAREVGR